MPLLPVATVQTLSLVHNVAAQIHETLWLHFGTSMLPTDIHVTALNMLYIVAFFEFI